MLTRNAPLRLSFVAFIIWGLCLIANYQVSTNGIWQLYSDLMRQDVRLYSDLKLPLQPLFFLFVMMWQKLLGKSWVLSQIPTIVSMITLSTIFYALAKRSNWVPWQQAIVFFCSSVVAVASGVYRFDDYRVLSDIFFLSTVFLLSKILDRSDDSKIIYSGWPVILGFLGGLCFTTRPNDGLLLLIATGAILFHGFPKQRGRLLLLLLVAFAAAALAVVLLTGDSLAAYFEYSLFRSAALKGGSQQVIFSPFMLVADVASYIVQPRTLALAAYFLCGAAVPLLAAKRIKLRKSGQEPLLIAAWLLAVLVFESTMFFAFNRFAYDMVAMAILPFLMVALLCVSVWAGLGVLGLAQIDNRKLPLFFVPFGGLIAGGMSSGGYHHGIYAPVGLFMVIVPLVYTLQNKVSWGRLYAISVYALLAIGIIGGKIQRPLEWQFYWAKPMFVDRALIRHPLYGPMLVDRRMDRFFQNVCYNIDHSENKTALLSIPFSYANYYCGIPPWNRNVQTYFDITTLKIVNKLNFDLKMSPPTWILYQRQLEVLKYNQKFFDRGQRSPYHDIDNLIEGQIKSGEWKIIDKWQEHRGNEWQLIRTSVQRK